MPLENRAWDKERGKRSRRQAFDGTDDKPIPYMRTKCLVCFKLQSGLWETAKWERQDDPMSQSWWHSLERSFSMSDLLVTQADHSKYQWNLEKAQKPGGHELAFSWQPWTWAQSKGYCTCVVLGTHRTNPFVVGWFLLFVLLALWGPATQFSNKSHTETYFFLMNTRP